MTVDLSGVHIPCVTPFAEETGDVDLDGFHANAQKWLEAPVRGLVVGGSTGEAVLLDEAERTELLTAARDVLGSDRLLIAGTGAESTRATLRLCTAAAQMGSDAVLVQPPAFYRGAMTDDVLVAHYQMVAHESPVPVILYQVPLRLSTVEFSDRFVVEMAGHENVIGMKDSRGAVELVRELVTTCGPSFQVLVGSGAVLFGGLEVGAVGGILGVANIAPSQSVTLYDAYRDGNVTGAKQAQEPLARLHQAVVGAKGVPGVKAALDMLGMCGGGPRSPLQSLGASGVSEVEGALRESGLLTG